MSAGTFEMGWKQVEETCYSIASKILDADIDVRMVVGISRGGLIPATLIAHRLGVRRVTSFQIGSYESGVQGAIQELEDRNYLVSAVEKAKTVLFVDDIVDSGNTMAFLRKRFGAVNAKVVFASMVVKTHKAPEETWGDFSGIHLSVPTWVGFPWEQTKEEDLLF